MIKYCTYLYVLHFMAIFSSNILFEEFHLFFPENTHNVINLPMRKDVLYLILSLLSTCLT